jgi:hypothetical protein
MSFLIDPPLLLLSGLLIFFAGKRLEWNRHAKIVVGIIIVFIFIVYSSLLYVDVFRFVFPFLGGMKSSEFMFHTSYTGISKSDVPLMLVIFLFLLYPFWIFAGYASALLISKRLRISKDEYSCKDVQSDRAVEPSVYAVARSPDAKKCVREAIDSIGGFQSMSRKAIKCSLRSISVEGYPRLGAHTRAQTWSVNWWIW